MMTPKEEAIREVLYKRAEICREARKASLAIVGLLVIAELLAEPIREID